MNRLTSITLAALLLAPLPALSAGDLPRTIQLDPASPGRVFEGIGAVSAGASTRLLPDNPEPQRRQVIYVNGLPVLESGLAGNAVLLRLGQCRLGNWLSAGRVFPDDTRDSQHRHWI